MEKKYNVLFVDDDSNILNSIKRILSRKDEHFNYFFATSGEEGLKIIQEYKVDIVISDMKMPIMDGANFLSHVYLYNPNIKRLILSGYSDEHLAIKSLKYAHQFIAKPIDANKINQLILQLIRYEEYLNNPSIRDVINNISILPTIPKLYLEIEEELKSENYSIRKIAEKVSQDISISVKLLQIVNSAFFGISRNIVDPKIAVNLLGIEIVKSVVLFSGLFKDKKNDARVNNFLEKIWEHSFRVATIMQKIIKIVLKDQKIADEAFGIGIIHDIGILVMLEIKDYINIAEKLFDDEKDLTELENYTYKTNHCVIGAYLLNLWGLPQILIEAIEKHHSAQLTDELVLDVLILANQLDFAKDKNQIKNKIVEKFGHVNEIKQVIYDIYGI
jgi:HD-like signal output (HDOD) protein